MLDDSIGCALWFAARGKGHLLTPSLPSSTQPSEASDLDRKPPAESKNVDDDAKKHEENDDDQSYCSPAKASSFFFFKKDEK